MEKNTAIGKFGIAFLALVALAFASAWIAGPGLSSARAENHGASASRSKLPEMKLKATFANSAPFRDGLFQGKLAKQRGEQSRVSQSRWAFDADQSAYARGYQFALAKHSGPQVSTLDAEQR